PRLLELLLHAAVVLPGLDDLAHVGVLARQLAHPTGIGRDGRVGELAVQRLEASLEGLEPVEHRGLSLREGGGPQGPGARRARGAISPPRPRSAAPAPRPLPRWRSRTSS